jgi:uroporphyrinogen-III synthase
MLVTRPEPDASETAGRLGALGIAGVCCPLLVHETLDTSLPDPQGFAAIAVTSANALRALSERGAIEPYLHLPFYAVGGKTAAAATALGFRDVTPAEGTFGALTELLAHSGISGPIFYPSARDVSGDLVRSLAPYGHTVVNAQVYAMNPVAELPETIADDLKRGAYDAVLLYSRRTAETFVRLAASYVDEAQRKQLGMLCMSEAVAAPVFDAHFVRVGLAEEPSEDAMMALALSYWRDQNA